VDIAVRAITLDRLEHSLALCEIPAENLASLRALLLDTEGESRMAKAFIAERASGHYTLVQSSGEDLAEALSLGSNSGLPDIAGRIYAAVPVWRISDALFYHELMDAQIDICYLPLDERVEASRRTAEDVELAIAEAGALEYPGTKMLLPALARAGDAELDAIARARVTRVALAVEQWRMAHGRWPDSLGQLVPEILDELPADPFTGKPLHWTRTDTGLTVYSVGIDATDEGGISLAEAKDPSRPGDEPFDIPFRLLDPERRGARTRTFRDEVIEADWLSLPELELFGFTEERLRGLGCTDEDLLRFRNRQ